MPTNFGQKRITLRSMFRFVGIFILFYFIFQFHHCVFDSADLDSPRNFISLFFVFFYIAFGKPASITTSQHLKEGLIHHLLIRIRYDTNKCLLFFKVSTTHAHTSAYLHPYAYQYMYVEHRKKRNQTILTHSLCCLLILKSIHFVCEHRQ